MPLKRASVPRTPTTTFCPPPAPCRSTASPRAPALRWLQVRCVWTMACARATPSARITTPWWPSLSCTATPAPKPWHAWTLRWRRPTSLGSRPMCSSCGRWCAARRLPTRNSTRHSSLAKRRCCSTKSRWVRCAPWRRWWRTRCMQSVAWLAQTRSASATVGRPMACAPVRSPVCWANKRCKPS